RVWRGVADAFRYDSDKIDNEDDQKEVYGLLGAIMAWQDAQAQRYYADLPAMPHEWQDASAIFGTKVVVTAPELRELAREVRELCEKYASGVRPVPEGAVPASIVFRALPRLGEGDQGLPEPDMK